MSQFKLPSALLAAAGILLIGFGLCARADTTPDVASFRELYQ